MTLLVTANNTLHILTSVESTKSELLKVKGYELNSEEPTTKDLLKTGFKTASIKDIFRYIDESDLPPFDGWEAFIDSFKAQTTTKIANDTNALSKSPQLKIEIKAIYEEGTQTLSFEAKAIDAYLNYAEVELCEEDIKTINHATEELTKAVLELAELAKLELNVVKNPEL